MRFAETKATPRRTWALLAAAVCLLAGLVAVASPGAADSAPLRVVVLGQTSETPPPSCPGKIVNNVEITPCRVEGHVTGFQSIADGVAAPSRRPSTARSSPGRSPSPSPRDGNRNDHRRGRLLQRLPRHPLGGPDRGPAAGRRHQAAAVQTGAPEPDRGPQPLLRQHPGLRPRPPAHRPPGPDSRAHRPHLGADVRPQPLPENSWRGSRLPEHCVASEDIQSGHPQQGVGKTKTYGCYYSEARLLYTATLVKKP